MKKNSGFTLLEILITISIMAILSILAAQAIRQSVQAKKKIQDQIDDLSRVRDAMRLMERDIALAFHHRDFEQEIADQIKKAENSNKPLPGQPGYVPDPNPPLQPQDQRQAPREDPVTHFVGGNEELNFVTMNNARMISNIRAADFSEVGYSLKNCKTLGMDSGKCLWRRSSLLVDKDVLTGGTEVALLDHVEELKFRYIGKGKQDWVLEWRSDSAQDATTKGNFPLAVEVSLTFNKKTGEAVKKYSMQIVAPLHFPNNKEEDSSGNNPQAPGAPQSTNQ